MQERRIRVIITSMITIVLAVVVANIAMNSYTDKKYKEELSQYHKYFTSIDVDYGDTVWDIYDTICTEYPETKTYHRNDFIREVKNINNLNYDYDILSGKKIVVPYYSSVWK